MSNMLPHSTVFCQGGEGGAVPQRSRRVKFRKVQKHNCILYIVHSAWCVPARTLNASSTTKAERAVAGLNAAPKPRRLVLQSRRH